MFNKINLTGTLAFQQLKIAKKRTVWTLFGIALSVAMLTAVNGFAASALAYLESESRTVHFSERAGLLLIALVLGSVIAVASVIVISNAFRVSAGERTRQFGILKSAGATKAQIRSIILYEAFYLSIVSIPVGVMAGLLVQFSVLQIINNMLQGIAHTGEDFALPFAISGWALLGAVAASFAVVLLSAWLPAAKAAKHPAVSALFHSDERTKRRGRAFRTEQFPGEKIKKLRVLGIIRLLFGVEGHLAAKQMKRSRRNYRATVLSLTISIILLLSSASLRDNLLRQWNVMNYDNVDANIVIYTRRSVYDIPLQFIQTATARLEEFAGAAVRGYGHSVFQKYVDGEPITVRVISVSPELYSDVVSRAGVPHGSNVIINVRNETDMLGITRQTHPFGYMVGETINLTADQRFGGGARNVQQKYIPIHGQIRDIPDDILFQTSFELSIIVPHLSTSSYYWFITTDYVNEFLDMAYSLRDEKFFDLTNLSVSIMNLDGRMAETRTLTNVITLLLYGFATMLALIALTNVISTISTNTRIRAREFAMLTSVGMTQGGIKRMLALESIISSARALVFGLPLGMLAARGVYVGTQMDRVRFGFIVPWQMIIVCVAGVFIVTFITTRFSAARLRKESVVETIRGIV